MVAKKKLPANIHNSPEQWMNEWFYRENDEERNERTKKCFQSKVKKNIAEKQ